jgi:phosphatidate cytidylyltransferase
MIFAFIAAILFGHINFIVIVMVIQIISFKEVVGIIDVASGAKSLRFTKSLNWYFLGSTMYFLYGESLIYYFKRVILVDTTFILSATHYHRFTCFMLYIFGQ